MNEKQSFRKEVKNDRPFNDYRDLLYINNVTDLKNKKILLVGGGTSPVLSDLEYRKILPARVENVDPYAFMPKNPRQKLVSEDYFDYQMQKDTWDEIWALYSLPAYCKTVSQIPEFYKKSLLGLAPKGNLRVCPTNTSLLMNLTGGVNLDRTEIEKVFIKFCEDVQDYVRIAKSGFRSVTFTAPQHKEKLDKFLEDYNVQY
jgi:hypothetical protein